MKGAFGIVQEEGPKQWSRFIQAVCRISVDLWLKMGGSISLNTHVVVLLFYIFIYAFMYFVAQLEYYGIQMYNVQEMKEAIKIQLDFLQHLKQRITTAKTGRENN